MHHATCKMQTMNRKEGRRRGMVGGGGAEGTRVRVRKVNNTHTIEQFLELLYAIEPNICRKNEIE